MNPAKRRENTDIFIFESFRYIPLTSLGLDDLRLVALIIDMICGCGSFVVFQKKLYSENQRFGKVEI